MNLVVGATGLLGTEICRVLTGTGRPVRALVRAGADAGKVAALKAFKVELATGDLKDAASLAAACRGASTVITTASSTFSRREGDSIQSVDRDGQIALVDAAKAAKVGHFVLVSFPPARFASPLDEAKRAVEQRLRASGMTHTILQPTFFMEVWLSPALGFDAAKGVVRIYGSGKQKISWISFRDVAKFAAAAAGHRAARNATLLLGGPEALSPLEVVEIFETATGRKFALQTVPETALRAQWAAATDPLQKSFGALMVDFTGGAVIDMRQTAQTFSVRLQSVKEFAAAAK
jgi:uncharacterized protein YbjT (DUF2867 family)